MTDIDSNLGHRVRLIRSWQAYVYVDISVEFENKMPPELSAKQLKMMVLSALKNLHGDYGAAIPVDILKFRPSDCRAYIRLPTKDYALFRTATTLFSSWDGQSCAFRMNKMAYSLSSLAVESCSTHNYLD